MRLLRIILLATLLFNCSLVSFNNAWAATLSESPANIAQGGTVTATWSAIAAPTNRDWIGLYAPSAVDTTFIDWIYVNTCSKSGGDATPANGSCPFLIPGSLPNGTYELRLFANNGYTRLTQSNSFNVAPVPPPSLRFVDNGDGTITDDQTGLMWEKKTGSVGSNVVCGPPPACPDPHNVNNVYQWSSSGTAPDGPLFTNFLARINTELSTSADGFNVADVCFAGHCDWRVPNIAELRTIRLLPACPHVPGGICIDPIFGPTQESGYWSSTTAFFGTGNAYFMEFLGGGVFSFIKSQNTQVRAVRGAR